MHRKKILRFGLSVAAALAVGLVGVALPAAAHDRDGNAPGPRGGWGTNWENPPGPRGGFGTSPDRVSRFHRFHRFDRDGNPPGRIGGRGTNWENPPGRRGGRGASPDRGRHHGHSRAFHWGRR